MKSFCLALGVFGLLTTGPLLSEPLPSATPSSMTQPAVTGTATPEPEATPRTTRSEQTRTSRKITKEDMETDWKYIFTMIGLVAFVIILRKIRTGSAR